MDREQQLINEAKEKFRADTFEQRVFVDKVPLLEVIDKHNLMDIAFFYEPSRIKALSNPKSAKLEEDSGFKFQVRGGVEILSFDGQWIYVGGNWANVRKATLKDIDDDVNLMIKREKAEFYS